jgi:nucleoid DNA-binding protein
MNKADLTDVVRKNLWKGATKAQAEKAVNAVLWGMRSGLKKDKTVQLVGFGTFNTKTRKARWGRNPATGEKIKIKASKTVGFKPGKDLKTYI